MGRFFLGLVVGLGFEVVRAVLLVVAVLLLLAAGVMVVIGGDSYVYAVLAFALSALIFCLSLWVEYKSRSLFDPIAPTEVEGDGMTFREFLHDKMMEYLFFGGFIVVILLVGTVLWVFA